VETSSE